VYTPATHLCTTMTPCFLKNAIHSAGLRLVEGSLRTTTRPAFNRRNHTRYLGACSHDGLATTHQVRHVTMSITPEGKWCSILRSSCCSQ
jgi:hypothetical protein